MYLNVHLGELHFACGFGKSWFLDFTGDVKC